MMQSASSGVRNAARKGSSTLAHHGGHNRAAANQTSRSIHSTSFLRSILHAPHLPSFPILPPRDPHYKLFSASKNFLQRLFTHLTAPGLRAPAYLTEARSYSAQSLHGTSLRSTTIQNGLSLPVRTSLRNHALQRQANMFLPQGPGPIPSRCGGVVQVGLGVARNFSTARPIFQQIAQNVPVAGRALYEINWDLETKKEYDRMRLARTSGFKKTSKARSMLKASDKVMRHKSHVAGKDKENNRIIFEEAIEHYFPSVKSPLVTTYLLIPLAPIPTTRLPLPPNAPDWEPTLLLPLPFINSLHASHSTHSLRVSTLFTRLDQAKVWSRGEVHCSAFSQGCVHQRWLSKQEGFGNVEGVCTILKIEFKGWSQSEVRSVIGESGTGWCVLEEVFSPEGLSDEEHYSDSDALASSVLSDNPRYDAPPSHFGDDFDPSQSLLLPTLDVSFTFSPSSSFAGSQSTASVVSSVPTEMESDPWVDYSESSLSTRSSSYSDLSDLIIDPLASDNGWPGASREPFGFSSHFDRRHFADEEPREQMFY